MNDSLNQKLREVEQEHAEGVVTESLVQHNQARRDAANRYIGGAMAIDRLKEHLASQVIIALMTVEEENLYLEFGCKTFAEFLDRKEFSEMSKSSFYRMRDLFLKEGPAKYDLLTDWGVPVKLRKQLEAGDIEIDGDEIVIGGSERVNIGESRVIKAIIEKLVTEKAAANEDLAKAETKIEKQATQIKTGTDEITEMQRNIDAMHDGDPHDQAFGRCSNSVIQLTQFVSTMTPGDKAKKGPQAIKTLWALIVQLRGEYGVSISLNDDLQPVAGAAAEGSDFDAKADAALAAMDFDDVEETES